MAYMRIRCDYCGGTWEVYHRDNKHDDRARTCPHCDKRIDYEIWDRNVVPAFKAVEDVNTKLYESQVNYHIPLFQIEFIPDIIFADRWRD